MFKVHREVTGAGRRTILGHRQEKQQRGCRKRERAIADPEHPPSELKHGRSDDHHHRRA
jgi:hypothetical protein